MLSQMFREVLEKDRAPIVICDVNHTIVYLNETATKNYQKWGGQALLGRSLLDCHNEKSRQAILDVVAWFLLSKSNNMIYTYKNTAQQKDVYMVALRDTDGNLIGYYEKHEFRKAESADLYDFSCSLV